MGGKHKEKKYSGRFPDLKGRSDPERSGWGLIWGILAAGILVGLLVTPAMAGDPIADFTMNPSSGWGRAPLTVYFTDTSLGNRDSWWWDFGDGGTSTLQNPVHEYKFAGTYRVTLTITWYVLPPITSTTYDTVMVYDPTLSLYPYSGRAGTPVTATGRSFSLLGAKIPYTTILFNGIAVASNVPMTRSGNYGSFTTTFTVPAGTAPGTYTVRAIGPLDTVDETFTVTNLAPRARIDADPLSGSTPLTVHFSGIRSSDEDGSISSYQWDFGDKGSATGPTVDHTYTRSGDYRARLTVIDNQGASGTAEVTISLENIPPVAEARASPTSGSDPLLVNFDGSQSYDPDGTIVSYYWTFGDGSWDRSANARHQYQSPQSYTAVLTVTDDKGLTGKDEVRITVGNKAPVADISVSPEKGSAPLTVTFDGSRSYDPDDTGLAFSWDFGDGSSGRGMVVTHTYREVGRYRVQLSVTDPHESTGRASETVEVVQPFPLWAPAIGVIGGVIVLKLYIDRPKVYGPGQSMPEDCRYPEPHPDYDVHCGVECKTGKDQGLPDVSVEVRSGILEKEEKR